MYSISRFQQVLKAVPQGAFDKIVQGHGGDRYVKRFRCRDQLVAMLYVQLAGAKSLRELEAGFNPQTRHHYHLATGRVARSTLSNANERRNPLIFADLLKLLIEQAGRALRRERQELLYLLDATTVPLPARCCAELRGHASARGNHGMKLHVQFEAGSAAVHSASITQARVNDITEGRKVAIETGATSEVRCGCCWPSCATACSSVRALTSPIGSEGGPCGTTVKSARCVPRCARGTRSGTGRICPPHSMSPGAG